MPERVLIFFQRVSVHTDGSIKTKVLYSTKDPEWADLLETHIAQDWEGTKDANEKARHSRQVTVVAVDEEAHKSACSRMDGRRNGMSARSVEAGQVFSTVTECAKRLGVTAALISNAFTAAARTSKRTDPSDYISVLVRGARLAYYDDWKAAQIANAGE